MRRTLLMLVFAMLFALVEAQSFDRVLFTGRFDFSDSVPSFSHVSSSISASFSGTGIAATFSGLYGTSYLYVVLDGIDDPENRQVIRVEGSEPRSFVLADELQAGMHRVEIVKINQYDTKLAFHGFEVKEGELATKPEAPPLSIEFYGDSNAAGHSAWDARDWGSPADNGGYFCYPGITARLLNAEYHNISGGGAGVSSRAWWNLRDYYHLLHMNDPESESNLWDFSRHQADVVVINLGANDYSAGASKAVIKQGWKDFILEDIRSHHPAAHVALLNAYGWALREPADYVGEAVEELKAAGEKNVSSVRIPWLWGQEHAVVNEHAGFAGILAAHIARELGMPVPGESELSSFPPYGEISNGGFEMSTLSGVADGWRPHGDVELLSDSNLAYAGDAYLKLSPGAWVNFASDAEPGDTLTIRAQLRGEDGGSGALKLEFKDQEQQTISAAEDRRTLDGTWEAFSVSLKTPRTAWSFWIVLESGQTNNVDFDQVELSLNVETGIEENEEMQELCHIFPNPCSGKYLHIRNPGMISGRMLVHDLSGRCIVTRDLYGEASFQLTFPRPLTKGFYILSIVSEDTSESLKFLVQ